MDSILDNELGYYQVNDKIFLNKTQAILESDTSNQDIKWIFFDHCWTTWLDNNRSRLGSNNLDQLYRQRALALRLKYDYLILNYSGGSDSHNILMTFLKNNITLDEIYVRYSNTVDRNLYVPDITNHDSSNIFSEYDYCIKPVLEYISRHFPDIKITIDDMFANHTDTIIDDDIFLKTQHHMGAFLTLRLASESKNAKIISDLGKSVAVIVGVDKPHCVIDHNKFYAYFLDAALVPAVTIDTKSYTTELFYWTHEYPEIMFEQAWACFRWFKNHINNVNKLDIQSWRNKQGREREQIFTDNLLWFNNICKNVIYSTWDNRFQTTKGNLYIPAGLDKDKFYLDNTELSNFVEKFNYQHQNLVNTVKNHNLLTSIKTFRACMSKLYYIGTIE